MKQCLTFKSAFLLLFLGILCIGCEDLGRRTVTLDNQSSHTVTVSIYLGDQDSQGYNIYEEFTVMSNKVKEINSKTSWPTVKDYDPEDIVDMEINGSTIVFTDY
jgi:hypothetical protein